MAGILIIDDTGAVRGLFRAILEQAGYTVHEASTGSEGLKVFRETPVDLVITDIYMPDGDGLEVITKLRQETSASKIIAISGRLGRDEMLGAAQVLGADMTLPKPVTMAELLTAVETLLGGPAA